MSTLFSSPLGLFALLGVPAVVALHLYRRRFRPQEVSAVFLWLDPDQSPAAGRKREPLRRSPSFYLELLAALALGLAFAGPRSCIAGPGGNGKHFVAVLDSSASMNAVHPDGASSRDRARDLILERVDDLPRGSRVTILATGEPPSILVGPAAFPSTTSEALDAWAPTRPGHDVLSAIALAEQLSGSSEHVLFVTDRLEQSAMPKDVEVLATGHSAANTGFVRVARERSDEGDRDVILASVAHFGPGPKTVSLSVTSAGTTLKTAEIELQPGTPRHWSFEIPNGIPTVTLELSEDSFTLDDSAVLAPTAPRTLALASSLTEDSARRLGLAPREGESPLSSWLALVHDAVEVPASSQTAHVLLTTGLPADSELGRSTWTLAVRAAQLEPAEPGTRQELIGPFLIDKKHPLLRGVTLEGIVWSRSTELAPLPGTPLVSAGSHVLLSEERVSRGNVFYHFNLDPSRSSLQRSPDWPILLANLAELRREALPGPGRTNLFSGDDLVLRTSPDRQWVLESPSGETRRAGGRDQLVFENLNEMGEWSLRDESASNARPLSVGVSFADPAESDLRERSSGQVEPDSAISGGEFRAEGGGPALWLALAALAFVLLDWLFLKRRAQA